MNPSTASAEEPRTHPTVAAVPVGLATEEELLSRFHETRDQEARSELLKRYEPFARSLAGRYRNMGESAEDLDQVAYLGLLHAIDRFDPNRGKPFVSFAAPTVLGELRRHLRDRVWSVRLPRSLQERTRRVERAVSGLSTRLGRSPSVAEIAAELELETDEVLEALDAVDRRRVGSLDAPAAGDGEPSSTLLERLGSSDAGFQHVEDTTTIDGLLPVLSEEERRVLRMRLVEGMTQSEIGERIGCSQMHVSRMLRRVLEALRRAYSETLPQREGLPV